MAAKKTKKSVRQSKAEKETFLNSFSIEKIIPSKYQTIFYLVLILIVFLIFFSPLFFGGQTFHSGDIVTSSSMKTYLEKERDGYTLWNPYVFGGMPAYSIAVGFKWFNLIAVTIAIVRDTFSGIFSIEYSKWAFYLLIFAYAVFAFFYLQTKNKLVSFLVANATIFSTGLIVFLFIGHVTKLVALWAFPMILFLLLTFQKRIKSFEILLLIFFIVAMFLGWHVQIIFYIFFAVMIYFIYFFFRSIRQKDNHLKKQIIKSLIVFVVAVVVALLIQSDNLTQIYEYTPHSTRGAESILEKEATATEQSESDFYQYATNWSFSPGEMLTFIIPSYYGFGKSTYRGPLSQNRPVEVNTYFGQMPFVDVAMYMGVIVFFLAIFSMIINWRDPLVRFLTILSLISLLISFGRTLPLIYDLMFYYFPFFDKFRVPSMILVLVQLSFPVLAGLGIVKILSLKNDPDVKVEKLIKNSVIVLGVLLMVFLILASPIKEWFAGRVTESGKWLTHIKPRYGEGILPIISDMFIKDARLAFFFSAAVFGSAYAFVKRKLSADLFVIVVVVLILIDLFRIDKRGETYVDKQQINILFEKPDYIQAIENTGDNSIYRVLNLKQDGSIGSLNNQNSNFLSYFLMYDIYGYSGIKPRSIQDYYDVLGSPANPTFWRMLNVKYLIFDQQVHMSSLELIYSSDKTFVYKNRDALPRAYFVNKVEIRRGIEILNMVKDNSLDPKNIAFIDEEIENIETPDSNAFVDIVEFKDEYIELDVNASGNNFLFLGDTYMSGEADYKLFKITTGWNAFIDGTETKIHKTNHGFRGVVIPEGRHKVVFSYLPQSFIVSKYLSLSLSALVILGLVIGTLFTLKRKKSKQ